MGKVNFFAQEHRRDPQKTDALLGICDPDGEECAYTTTEENGKDKWCARILNENRKKLIFIPIDKNIDIRRPNGDEESTCDGMVFLPETRELSFVELKDYHVGGAISGAKGQLINTLHIFNANHNYRDFHNRRAYACNRRHPHFATSARAYLTEFRNETHFAFMPQAIIEL